MKKGQKKQVPLSNINEIMDELYEHDKSGLFFKEMRNTDSNKQRLEMLIPKEYFEKIPQGTHYWARITEKPNLSCLLTANFDHCGIKEELKVVALDLLTLDKYNQFLQGTHDRFVSEYMNSSDLCNSIPDNLKHVAPPYCSPGTPKDYIIRTLHYLYSRNEYCEFFWWLLIELLFYLTPELVWNVMPKNIQYSTIVTSHDLPMQSFSRSQMAEISEDSFWGLRKNLIQSAEGHLIIAGPSLMDAFNKNEEKKCIIDSIRVAVRNGKMKKLSILLTDPILFDTSESGSEPIRDTSWAVSEMEESLYILFEDAKIELHIYFLPLLQIDHAVMTDEFLAMRSTKLWTRDRKYKGAFVLYLSDIYVQPPSEYGAHKEYLQAIIDNSTKIYPAVDTNEDILNKGSAASQHMKWRKNLRDNHYRYIFMHKLYEKQLFTFVRNSWRSNEQPVSRFVPSSQIKTRHELFNYKNLLGDNTQCVLLDYLKKTEALFTDAIRKHDSSINSKCEIFPSLDLGVPNNVQRLAGGFATGMLVTWNCGIDIVPIDATVNVCTSSVYKLSCFDPQKLQNRDRFTEELKQIFHKASEDKGYSFAFTSGNHFLMIGTSLSEQGNIDYYLVLHSSANELKNSYMGLYPIEKNWYSSEIKYVKDSSGRYFRYLKDEAAHHFITMAHHFEQYNVQIHEWLATKINSDTQCKHHWSSHHYYMPTDSSIAMGTFVEPEGAEVPIFSMPGKPVYIYKIGKDNWQVDLGEKRGRVCLVPHGWGQKVNLIQGVDVKKDYLILNINGKLQQLAVSSKSRIDCAEKVLRDFKDGQSFLSIGSKYVHGSIKQTITPCYEYSRHTMR